MLTRKKMGSDALWNFAGLLVTPLRLVTGWLLFSAMWRRLVLQPADLDILSPMYEGLKFNHFLVSSEWITPLIQYFISHPFLLYVFLWIFTFIEGILGLCLLCGLFTRIAGLGAFFLLGNVMLGAGWLGTTCVDEWQIGVLGMSSGLVICFAGGGPFSLDNLFFKQARRFWTWISSGPFFIKNEKNRMFITVMSITFLLFVFTLATNQINVKGVWGPFHNPAVKPHLSLFNASIDSEGVLKFTLIRDGGPDTYGAFISELKVISGKQKTLLYLNGDDLGNFSTQQIQNKNLVKVAPNGQSLVVPLGAQAEITLFSPLLRHLPKGTYTLELTDISNIAWTTQIHD